MIPLLFSAVLHIAKTQHFYLSRRLWNPPTTFVPQPRIRYPSLTRNNELPPLQLPDMALAVIFSVLKGELQIR